MSDDELAAQMHDDLYDGLADEIVIGTMTERGIRDAYIVLVGGAPLNEGFAGSSAQTRTAATRPLPRRPRRPWCWRAAQQPRRHEQASVT